MTMTGGPGARGLTIADVRTRIDTLKKRASGPMHAISLIESEMALLHLLGRSGRPKDYEECLQLGEDLWVRFSEEARHIPEGGASPTKGLALHLCTTMRHSAKMLGDESMAATWVQRLGALHESYMNPHAENPQLAEEDDLEDGAGATDDESKEAAEPELDADGKPKPKLGAFLRKFELDERGVRRKAKWKTGTGVGDQFQQIRHPMMDLPFQRAQKGYKPNPDSGSRY
jgi:hypothetical protein